MTAMTGTSCPLLNNCATFPSVGWPFAGTRDPLREAQVSRGRKRGHARTVQHEHMRKNKNSIRAGHNERRDGNRGRMIPPIADFRFTLSPRKRSPPTHS